VENMAMTLSTGKFFFPPWLNLHLPALVVSQLRCGIIERKREREINGSSILNRIE
jgi:hypothetical protein